MPLPRHRGYRARCPDHALEALINRNRNPHADALALSALKLIGAHLETAAHEPGNRTVREAMMLGATHAGLAVSNTSTALVHGLSRPIGAFFHVPHGLSKRHAAAAGNRVFARRRSRRLCRRQPRAGLGG